MKTQTKKLGLILAAAMLCASLFGAGGAAHRKAFADTEPTPIDMYLIAGQSNAAGYSTASGVSGPFNNVMYGGEVNRTLAGATAYSWLDFEDFKPSVTTGYGRQSGYIGPEFGMAEKFNEAYAGETKAFIFKSAAGGTSLKDRSDGEIGTYGNWYPRSLGGRSPGTATGAQYDNFVSNFTKVYGELKAHGYAPKVRAMIWMQGEADIAESSLYEGLIKTFIQDIRKDLSEIAEDKTLATMPFIMGEISTSFGSYNNVYAPGFIEMQRRVANSMDGVYTVYTGDLPINDASGTVGTDRYHWSGKDMRTLGNRFGEKALEVIDTKFIPITVTGEGRATYAYQGDGSIRVTLTPTEGYRLTFLSVNGTDVTKDVSEGVYTIAAGTEVEIVKAAFSKNYGVTLAYEYKESEVTVTGPGGSDGGEITVTAVPKEGYKVVSVTYYANAAFRGSAFTRVGETNEYKLGGVPYAGRVVVETASLSGGTDPNFPEPSEGGNKKGLIIGLSVAGGVLVIASVATAVLLLKRKKK